MFIYQKNNDLEGKEFYKIHKISKTIQWNSTTEKTYTGLNFTIPVGAFYVISATANYTYSKAIWCGISKTSDSDPDQTYSCREESNGSVVCTITGEAEERFNTLYIFAQYISQAINVILLEGFYIEKQIKE